MATISISGWDIVENAMGRGKFSYICHCDFLTREGTGFLVLHLWLISPIPKGRLKNTQLLHLSIYYIICKMKHFFEALRRWGVTGVVFKDMKLNWTVTMGFYLFMCLYVFILYKYEFKCVYTHLLVFIIEPKWMSWKYPIPM